MMLFADSPAMPTLKLNKKRIPKKVPVHEGKVTATVERCNYRKELTSMFSKAEENLGITAEENRNKVSNGIHSKEATDEAAARKRKASRDAQVALHLHFKDSPVKTPQGKQKDAKKLGIDNGHSGRNTSRNGDGVDNSLSSIGAETGIGEKDSNGSSSNLQDIEKATSQQIQPEKDSFSPPHPKKSKLLYEHQDQKQGKNGLHAPSSKPGLSLASPKKGVKRLNRVGDIVPADNYVRRMASLNASACVSALMEADKKDFSKAVRSPEASLKVFTQQSPPKSLYGVASVKDESFEFGDQLNGSLCKRSPTPSSCSSLSCDSQSLRYSPSDIDIQAPQVMGTLLALLDQQQTEDEELPYNRLGLLYNGDTFHPAERLFYNSDTDLTLPQRIIPKVFPSRDFFVAAAIQQVMPLRTVGKKKKAAKGNNGWMALGDPVKVIEYNKTGQDIMRRFYAGIRRGGGKEVIFVRDNIVVRAGGDDRGDKPFIAKIASIWRETAGQLMMTVFWYYRPEELDSATLQSNSFLKDELLASQHNDDNSVACIEDKCHILGVSQYCRYNAYRNAKASGFLWKNGVTVPSVPTSVEHKETIDLLSKDPQTLDSSLFFQRQLQQGSGMNNDSFSKLVMAQEKTVLAHPDMQAFPQYDSDLVFLCYRGYNHCQGKISSKSLK